jgi:hypothetical protein
MSYNFAMSQAWSPMPRTFFLAAPNQSMDALWIGDRNLLHPFSPHAGTDRLQGGFSLHCLLNQRRCPCIVSIPLAQTFRLASALVVSVILSYILGVLFTAVSALASLHVESSKIPLSWTLVAAEAFEATIVLIAWSALLRHQALRHRGRAKGQTRGVWSNCP